MGDLKPVGSEKLQGNEKIKRILDLTYYNEKPSNTNQGKVAELVKESANGVYGIVREKNDYYVKKGLNEQSLDYIGGLFMKNKNRFNSYAEALKRLELLSSQELNEDVTKYVLKTNKNKEEAPLSQPPISDTALAPEPEMNMSASDEPVAPDMGVPASDEPSSLDMGQEESPEQSSKRSDYMAEVQKFAGKLGQELRDQQVKMESDDIKYVLNMVISAVDLDKLDDEDIEEIGKKFDRDEEAQSETEPEQAEEPSSEEEPEQTPEDDLAERISKLEELINTKFDSNEQDLGEYDDFENNFFFDDEDFERRDHGLDPVTRRPDGTKFRPEEDNNLSPMDRMYNSDDWVDAQRAEMGYKEEDDEDLDITPELGDINESINNTLSKYFE